MALLSVSQYAKKTGKDPGNIRKMLLSGRLSGARIGNQWAIEESAPYPEDRRIRSNQYRDWRRRTGVFRDRTLARSVNAMMRDLQEIYGDHLIRIVLYGSYATGLQTEESDIDIALMLSNGSGKKNFNRMIKCVSEREIECGKTLSVIEVRAEQYEEWKTSLPFYKNIEREGICLWMKR